MTITDIGYISSRSGFRLHAHEDEYEIHYLTEGAGVFINAEKRHRIEKRSLVFSRPKETHAYESEASTRRFSFYFVRFRFSNDESGLPQLLDRRFSAPVSSGEDFRSFFEEMKHRAHSSNLHLKRAAELSLNAFIHARLGESAHTPEENRYVRTAIDIMERSVHATIDLPSLTNKLGITVSYFDRLFKKHRGVSPLTYYARLKIETASFLLRETDTPIYRIAEELSYTDEFHFSRAFKRIAGVSPREFRKRG
ncbi:MAG: helix-turn-helix domain-containing protein [Spirochaetota bacterium]